MTGLFDSGQRISVAVCTPWPGTYNEQGKLVHEPMSPLWFRHRAGIHLPTNYNSVEVFADGMPVDVARNEAVAGVLKMDPVPQFIFFLDYDVLIPPDALTKLFFRAKCFPDHDIFAGVYCCKGVSPPDPLIYTDNGAGAFWDWAVGDLLRTETHGIKAVHSGLTLIRTSLYQRMLANGCVHGTGTDLDDEPFYKTHFDQAQVNGASLTRMSTEDIYFCDKAVRLAGAKILVDTSVLAGHLDKRTGIVYGLPWGHGPTARAKWMRQPGSDIDEDRKEAEAAGLKLALDIGAGEERRQWDGYRTYTTDIRPGAGVDYVMDSRLLNFPDGHFDLTASTHHLEHLGRWDQERAWKEIFRITRPGGTTEHIVPSLDWAVAKLWHGEADWHVFNVLYGAQEATCAWGAEHNTHRFGYTKAGAIELAKHAGFVDVQARDWRDDAELGLNLVITGRRPAAEEANDVGAERDAAGADGNVNHDLGRNGRHNHSADSSVAAGVCNADDHGAGRDRDGADLLPVSGAVDCRGNGHAGECAGAVIEDESGFVVGVAGV